MILHICRSRLWVLLIAWCIGIVPGRTQAQTRQLTGAEILGRVEGLYADINDYTVTLDVVTDLERVNIPPMHVTMYFKKPNKIHFDAEGFAILPREGLGIAAGQISARYTVESVGREMLDSTNEYLLTLVPKEEKLKLRTVSLDVNPLRWTPDRIVSHLPDGRTMSVSITHEKFEGRWLPSLMLVSFSSPAHDTSEAAPWEQVAPQMRRAAPRSGTVTVRYSDYRINSGLNNDVFRQEPK